MKLKVRQAMDEVLAVIRRMSWNERVQLLLQAMTAFLCFAMVVMSPTSFGGRFFVWLGRLIGDRFIGVMLSMVVIVMGFLAHHFKQANQKVYGYVEVLFGASYGISVALSIRPTQPMFSHWATLVGCTYVIARGLNNIDDADAKMART